MLYIKEKRNWIDVLYHILYNSILNLKGKSSSVNFLQSIGATNIIMRDEYLEAPAKAIERPLFASAIDTVGGNVLSKMLPQISPHGVVACCGNVAGI